MPKKKFSVEGSIRPVFQRQRTTELPTISLFSDTITGDGTTDHNIQPPVGTIWSLNYAQMYVTTAGGATTASIALILSNGTTEVVLKKDASLAANDSISFGAFGNGPLLLTNSRYLILRTVVSGHSANWVIDSAASYEVVQ